MNRRAFIALLTTTLTGCLHSQQTHKENTEARICISYTENPKPAFPIYNYSDIKDRNFVKNSIDQFENTSTDQECYKSDNWEGLYGLLTPGLTKGYFSVEKENTTYQIEGEILNYTNPDSNTDNLY